MFVCSFAMGQGTEALESTAAWNQADAMQRLALISQAVGRGEVNGAMAKPTIRREAMRFLDGQAARVRATTGGLDPQLAEERERLEEQSRGQVGGTYGGVGGIYDRQVDQAMRQRGATGPNVAQQQEFKARVNGYNQLMYLNRRGQILQDIQIPRDLLDGMAQQALATDPRYTQGTPKERMQVLRELKVQNVWSPTLQAEATRVYQEIVRVDTAGMSARDAVTGEMILLRRLRKDGMIAGAEADPIEERLISQFIALHPRTASGSAAEKLKMLRVLAMDHQLVGGVTRAKLEQPILIQALREDPAFMSADAATKRAVIRGMKERGEINFYTVSKVEAEFGLRSGEW